MTTCSRVPTRARETEALRAKASHVRLPRCLARVAPSLACAGALAAAAPGGSALAAAFQLRENTAAGLGTSFAGVGSAAETPDTVSNNPAGMVRLPGLQVYLGGSIIIPSATFRGTATDRFGRVISGDTERDAGNAAVVPFGHVAYRVTPDLSVGLSITSPYGLATYYGPGWAGRYLADKTDLRTIDFNPAVAYRIAPWLSVGAGLSVQTARAVFSSSINSSTLTGRLLPLQDGLFNLRGDDVSVGYNVGVLIEPRAGTRIGLTYRSRIQHDFEGQTTYNLPAALLANPLLRARFRNGPGRAKLVLPDTAGVSVTQEFGPRWTGYLDVNWTNWSLFKRLGAYRDTGELITNTPQNYRDSFFVALGASYRASDWLTLRAGTAFDKTPVRDAFRTARVPDEDRYWLSVGASARLAPNMVLDAGYAHLFLPDARINETSTTGDVLRGRYDAGIDLLTVGLRSSF